MRNKTWITFSQKEDFGHAKKYCISMDDIVGFEELDNLQYTNIKDVIVYLNSGKEIRLHDVTIEHIADQINKHG